MSYIYRHLRIDRLDIRFMSSKVTCGFIPVSDLGLGCVNVVQREVKGQRNLCMYLCGNRYSSHPSW